MDAKLREVTDRKHGADLLLDRAGLEGALGRFGDARSSLTDSVSLCPDDNDVILARDYISALILEAEQKIDEAFSALTKLLSNYTSKIRIADWKFVYEDIHRVS